MDDGPDTIRRIAVALSLSAGRCSAAENGGERSALRVIPGGTLSGGVAMNLRSAWARPNYRDAQGELLAVRTPFVTSQCGDKETMSHVDYTQSLAAHVVATLRAGAAELLTVSHGATGSGKSTFLFGPAVSSSYGYGYGESDREAPLFTSVLSRLFAAGGPSLSAAVSVVELRPSPSQRDKDEDVHAYRANGNKQDEKKEGEKIAAGKEKEEKKIVDSDSDGGADEDVPVDVFDLLSRAVDHRTPTRSFMEDFADIPATRYVRCETAAEAIAVLHEALRHSTAWRAARETEHKPRDASNNNNSNSNNNSSNSNSDNKGNITNNIDRDSREGAEDGPMDFLYPRAGANAHILVTLLLRTCDTGAAAVSVWRLWDLSGAAVWPDDGTPAARMAFATHAALCEVAHRHRHRNALQGGWWPAAAPPAHVAEVIPLPHVLRRDPAAAMIEAALQHSSSAVLWVTALRCDACFDEVNEDALEVAAALNEISEEETNERVIAELRRRRRRENLKAAARVLDLFATPFRTLIANGSAGEGPRRLVEGRGLREALPIGTWSATLCDDDYDNDATTTTTSTTAAPWSRNAPMRQAEPTAASPVHDPPPPLLLSPVSPRPRLMSPPLPCGISQAFGKRASSQSPPSVADTDLPACDAEAHSKSTNAMHNNNAEGRGGEEEEEPEQAFSRAPSPIPFTCDKNAEDHDALAAAVRRVLTPALAEMRCATERYDTLAAELIEQHTRFTARLRSLLESDVRSLSELRRRIEGLAASEFPWGEHRHRAEAHRSVWREEDSGEGIVSVFRDILQRCSEMHAEQRTAAHQAQRERDAALAELRLIQSDSTAAAVCDSAARRNGAAESPPRPLFSERTNTAHTKGPDAAELLRRVLMRATTFAVAEGDAALSIARTSDPQLLGNGGEAHRVNGARGGKSVPRGGTAAAISRRGDHVAARGSYSAE